jgi:hypothetical protein
LTLPRAFVFRLAFGAWAVGASAQETAALRGAYRFAHFTWSDGAKLAAASQGGTISFDGAGGVTMGEKSGTYAILEPYLARLDIGGNTLAVRFNLDAEILAGSAAEAGPTHHLFAAVRAAEGIRPQETFRGVYGAAALTLQDAAAAP